MDDAHFGYQASFSPDGAYLYAEAGLTRNDDFRLARWRVPDAPGGAPGPREWVPGGMCRYGIARGPDGRLYTAPSNAAINYGTGVGYVDRPDRWFARERAPDGDAGALVRPGGADFVSYRYSLDTFLGGLVLPTIPVTLPELRTPRLRGDNVTTCGTTADYRLVENCYQTLADVTVAAGPGVTVVQRRGADVTLRFDSVAAAGAPALEPVRYVALAHAHPCRTYRDTLWVLVEGTCNEPLGCVAAAVAAPVTQRGCDSARVLGRMRDVAGLYRDTLAGIAQGGCDSVRQVQLTLGQTVRTASAMSICLGQTALIHGQPESAAADYSQSFTSVTGCDSVSTVTLTVAGQAVAPAVMQSGCDSVVVFGRMRDVSGLYLDTLVGAARGGCDSVRQVQLTLGQTVRTASAMSICAGQTALIHGRPESAAADYRQTFTSVTGCDSVSTVTLAVAGQAVAPAVAQAGCDSVVVFGRMRDVAGLYLDTLVGAARGGCDSVRQVQLTLGQTVRTASAVSICAGQTALIHGQPESAAADYTQTFTSLAGCDSVSTVTLAVGATVVAAADTVRACDSATVFGVTRDAPGVYLDTLLQRARGGCDSVRQVVLHITARPTWALAGLPGDTTLAPGDTLAVAVAGGGADGLGVRWTPPGAVACDTCARTAVAGTFDGRVTLAVAPEGVGAGVDAGCAAEHTFRIARLVVADEEVVEVYQPTAFSPNGDGVNDGFGLGLPVGWTVVAAEVYDRWGGLVRRVGAACPCGRDGQGMVMLWDGRAADGRAYNPAVFVWWARVRRADGEEVVVKGDVTLVR